MHPCVDSVQISLNIPLKFCSGKNCCVGDDTIGYSVVKCWMSPHIPQLIVNFIELFYIYCLQIYTYARTHFHTCIRVIFVRCEIITLFEILEIENQEISLYYT